MIISGFFFAVHRLIATFAAAINPKQRNQCLYAEEPNDSVDSLLADVQYPCLLSANVRRLDEPSDIGQPSPPLR